MRMSRGLPLLALSALLLGGCTQDPSGTTSPGPGVSAGSSDRGGAATAPLTLTTAEGTTPLEVTEVQCSGAPGDLQHLIGTTDHQPPLVKLTPGEFAMVQLGHDRPYETTDPEGITVGEDGVAFAGTPLGEATLDGTMTCTRWE